ncbi:hypothetical protein RF11_10438 [Thelohanellus kitauei]|uniref:Uncharacterized protein n=1 Tax=Thelohanellus kitauei TaxID=669202 RepID=A0A0C2NFM9_THEKT|nr:hypothetical protein RF11_10438 [Thelohanellus kitauei]
MDLENEDSDHLFNEQLELKRWEWDLIPTFWAKHEFIFDHITQRTKIRVSTWEDIDYVNVSLQSTVSSVKNRNIKQSRTTPSFWVETGYRGFSEYTQNRATLTLNLGRFVDLFDSKRGYNTDQGTIIYSAASN